LFALLPDRVRLAINSDDGAFSYGHASKKFRIQRAFDVPGQQITPGFVEEHCADRFLAKVEALKHLQSNLRGVHHVLRKETQQAKDDIWVHDKGQAGLRGATLALLRAVLGLGPLQVATSVTAPDVKKNMEAGGTALLAKLAQDGGLTKPPFNLRQTKLNSEGSVSNAITTLRSLLKRSGLTIKTTRRGRKKTPVYTLDVHAKVEAARSAAADLGLSPEEHIAQLLPRVSTARRPRPRPR
jgi:hypothetical protein